MSGSPIHLVLTDRLTAAKWPSFREAAQALVNLSEEPLPGALAELMEAREVQFESADGAVSIRVITTRNRVLYIGTSQSVAATRLVAARRNVASWQAMRAADSEISLPEDSPYWAEYVAAAEAYAIETREEA